MKTVIVPVDFSETSLNAARYATKLLTGYYGVNMILFNVFSNAQQAEETNQKLKDLKDELMSVGIVKTSCTSVQGNDLIDELEELANEQKADLIIMGITGRSALGQTFIGSNTLKMVEKKICPVLIIPEHATYKDVKNVLLTTEFKDVADNTPAEPIKNVLKPFSPSLHIMNVNSEIYVSLSEDYQAEKSQLNKMFGEFNPEFYFLGLYDIDEAINQFATDKNIDFIIVVHRDQNLFSKFFIKSHTKKLAYKSQIPVLAIHE